MGQEAKKWMREQRLLNGPCNQLIGPDTGWDGVGTLLGVTGGVWREADQTRLGLTRFDLNGG